MKNIAVGIGEALWDVLPEGRKIGGAPANFAYHVGQFGLPSCVVSAVGDDELGREIVARFEEKELRYILPVVAEPTGTVEVELDGAGVPRYDIREDVAWDNIPVTPELEELAQEVRAVCFGSLAQRSEVSRNTIRRFLEAVPRREDTLIVFDVNLRQHFYSHEILEESMQLCNVLKINDEELVTVSDMFGLNDKGDADDREICRRLVRDYGLKALILTCGVNGSYVFTPEEESFMPTPKVIVADTVGAGDSFTAAFVSGLLRGFSVREAHELAVATSAFVCSQDGAMPVLPDNLLRK
ncbi:MAG: carbohydrate kinase [Paramuribaculum sp.]|nr:carbohydrate kinase [Paramuribaculum sp.]